MISCKEHEIDGITYFSKIVISDMTPIISLLKIKRLELLNHLFGDVRFRMQFMRN